MNDLDGTGPTAAELVHRAHAVIFDCDDTVLATAKTRWRLLIATARSFGVRLREDTIRQAWGLPFDRLIRTIVPTIDYDLFVPRYLDAMRANPSEPTAGATDLLAHLAARSTRMEILSSSKRNVILQDLDALRLTGYFAHIYDHEETGFHKPDPHVLDIVIDNLVRRGFDARRLVYIGDSVRDLLVAAGQAIDFVAVLSGMESAEDFVAAGLPPHLVVDNLAQLITAAE